MVRVNRLKIHAPDDKALDRIMNMLKEGRGEGVQMNTVVNRGCQDPKCNDIHAVVTNEVPPVLT